MKTKRFKEKQFCVTVGMSSYPRRLLSHSKYTEIFCSGMLSRKKKVYSAARAVWMSLDNVCRWFCWPRRIASPSRLTFTPFAAATVRSPFGLAMIFGLHSSDLAWPQAAFRETTIGVSGFGATRWFYQAEASDALRPLRL